MAVSTAVGNRLIAFTDLSVDHDNASLFSQQTFPPHIHDEIKIKN